MPLEVKSIFSNIMDMVSKPSGNVLINPFITSILIVSFILFLLFLFGESDNLIFRVGIWGGIFTTVILFYHNKALKADIESKLHNNDDLVNANDININTITPALRGGGNESDVPKLPNLRTLNH